MAEKDTPTEYLSTAVKTQYGELLNVSISESGLKELQENQSKGYVNVTFAERREADKKVIHIMLL